MIPLKITLRRLLSEKNIHHGKISYGDREMHIFIYEKQNLIPASLNQTSLRSGHLPDVFGFRKGNEDPLFIPDLKLLITTTLPTGCSNWMCVFQWLLNNVSDYILYDISSVVLNIIVKFCFRFICSHLSQKNIVFLFEYRRMQVLRRQLQCLAGNVWNGNLGAATIMSKPCSRDCNFRNNESCTTSMKSILVLITYLYCHLENIALLIFI